MGKKIYLGPNGGQYTMRHGKKQYLEKNYFGPSDDLNDQTLHKPALAAWLRLRARQRGPDHPALDRCKDILAERDNIIINDLEAFLMGHGGIEIIEKVIRELRAPLFYDELGTLEQAGISHARVPAGQGVIQGLPSGDVWTDAREDPRVLQRRLANMSREEFQRYTAARAADASAAAAAAAAAAAPSVQGRQDWTPESHQWFL